MDTIEAAQITCTVYQSVTSKALRAMADIGVKEYYTQSSRAVVLRRKSGFLGIGAGVGLEEEPANRIYFHVRRADAEVALRTLSASCSLGIPGRGSAIWEDVTILRQSAWDTVPLSPTPGTELVTTQDNLASITCTVQHGRGNNIVRAVLNLGVPMPLVTAGSGTGLRDKLGLIRIALPAAKETVHAIVSAHEVTDILGSLVEAGRLDRLGAGFIYESPVSRGVMNSMVIRGQRHSASIEQLITAVDDLKGSANWRKRSLGSDRNERERNYLRNLVNVTLICNEGWAGDLIQAAMAAGAGGATIIKLHHVRTDGATTSVSPAREMTELVVGEGVVEPVVTAMEAAGVFREDTAGFISLKPVNLACTHRGARRR